MPSNIELNHLKYFYFTVLEGSVAQAANRLHVQQPVVSKMLKTLEENLGNALFFKQGRSKSLTDYGQLIFRHCQVVFEEINKIQNVSEKPNEVKGVFNIGAPEPIVNYIFPKVFGDLISAFPNLNCNVYTTTQSQLLKMISNDQIELGCFFYVPKITEDLEVFNRIPYNFKLVVKTSAIKNKEVLQSFIGSREIDDLSTHSFPTVDLLRKKHPKTRIVFSANSISLHKELVKLGKGVAIMPEFMIHKELKSKYLTELFPSKKFKWDLMFVKRKSYPLSFAGQELINRMS